MSAPTASVIVCTHNRATLLAKALDSLTRQTLPVDRRDIVVVDNASTDETRSVVEAFTPSLPALRYVHESRLGLSAARNRGATEARGDVLVFLDDDAVAEPDWLQALLAAYEQDPAVVAVAGRIELLWLAPRPAWMPKGLEGYYTKLDLGSDPMVLSYPRYPYGANMSVRADTFAAAGRFREDLGRKGTRSLLSNEEKDFFKRVAALSGTVVYEPHAGVLHSVAPERARPGWLLRRSFGQGRSEAVAGLSDETTFLSPACARHVLGGIRAATIGCARASLRRRTPREPSVRAEALVAACRSVRWWGYAWHNLLLFIAPPARGSADGSRAAQH